MGVPDLVYLMQPRPIVTPMHRVRQDLSVGGCPLSTYPCIHVSTFTYCTAAMALGLAAGRRVLLCGTLLTDKYLFWGCFGNDELRPQPGGA